MAWRKDFFCLAGIRPGGFAAYQQIDGGSNRTDAFTTKPVSVVAESPYVKVTVPDKDNKRLAEGSGKLRNQQFYE